MTCLIAMQKVEGSNPFSRFSLQISAFHHEMNLSDGEFSTASWALKARTTCAFFAVF